MNRNRLKDTLLQHEGLRLDLYKCPANKLTIGVGRNLEDRGISRDEALLMLENDITNTYVELSQKLKEQFNIKLENLSDVRQEVLLNMAFQMGVPRLLKFKKTFSYIKHLDFEKASVEMLDSFWFRQMHEFDMRDGTDSVNRAEQLSYAMKHDKFLKGALL